MCSLILCRMTRTYSIPTYRLGRRVSYSNLSCGRGETLQERFTLQDGRSSSSMSCHRLGPSVLPHNKPHWLPCRVWLSWPFAGIYPARPTVPRTNKGRGGVMGCSLFFGSFHHQIESSSPRITGWTSSTRPLHDVDTLGHKGPPSRPDPVTACFSYNKKTRPAQARVSLHNITPSTSFSFPRLESYRVPCLSFAPRHASKPTQPLPRTHPQPRVISLVCSACRRPCAARDTLSEDLELNLAESLTPLRLARQCQRHRHRQNLRPIASRPLSCPILV